LTQPLPSAKLRWRDCSKVLDPPPQLAAGFESWRDGVPVSLKAIRNPVLTAQALIGNSKRTKEES